MRVLVLMLGLVAGVGHAAPPRARPDPVDPYAQAQAPLPTRTLTVRELAVQAEVADSRLERGIGLMHRTSLPAGTGMLFVYPAPRHLSFWMRNTLLPLSIAFLDTQGRVVRLADMKPLDESHVPSGAEALYALEVPRGWFVEHGVQVGDIVAGLPGPAPE